MCGSFVVDFHSRVSRAGQGTGSVIPGTPLPHTQHPSCFPPWAAAISAPRGPRPPSQRLRKRDPFNAPAPTLHSVPASGGAATVWSLEQNLGGCEALARGCFLSVTLRGLSPPSPQRPGMDVLKLIMRRGDLRHVAKILSLPFICAFVTVAADRGARGGINNEGRGRPVTRPGHLQIHHRYSRGRRRSR